MRPIYQFFLLLMLSFNMCQSLACTPLPRELFSHSETRVREKFESVDSVELMTFLDTKLVKTKLVGLDFEVDVPLATFRVDQVFKGDAKVGDLIVFEQRYACAIDVKSAGRLEFKGKSNSVKGSVAPRQWLIYRRHMNQSRTEETEGQPAPPTNQIENSPMTRPIDEAFSEIKILLKLQKEAAAKN